MYIAGIDIGTLYFKAVISDISGKILTSKYIRHHGTPWKAFRQWAKEIEPETKFTLGICGVKDEIFLQQSLAMILDGPRCLLEGAKISGNSVNAILDIGGSSLNLIELNSKGEFESYSTNSLCAAGTGSFLDEQAYRLGIDYSDLKSFEYVESPPTIATRCAVFAKSDLIHRQQEGFSKPQMWSGLCKGLCQTIINTLYKGRPVRGNILVTGGVSQNSEVLRWLKFIAPEANFHSFPYSHLLQALGAGYLAYRLGCSMVKFKEILDSLMPLISKHEDSQKRYDVSDEIEPLELKLSRHPSFDVEKSYLDSNNTEVRISYLPAKGSSVKCYLGIDIGSTSTKCVLIDEEGKVFIDCYRKTLADPIGATRYLFEAIEKIQNEYGIAIDIAGCGTTGSGRKMIGMIVGADLILNEITAHVKGALSVDPETETIFEIGGQDSKFIRLHNGQAVDSNMNYICAAGTGSFIEEQANKLGYKISEIGDLVMGIKPPPTSDRCTVFMEQDLNSLLRRGYQPTEALAGIMRSIVKNYLNKVVGKRKFSTKKIAFMGATARNKGLVAAFEKHLNAPIVVSPYCHVMGAYGVAVSTKDKITKSNSKTTFKGIGIFKRKIEIKKSNCKLCNNNCTITHAVIENEPSSPSWGYLCGREPDETKARIIKEYDLFRVREKLLRTCGKVDGLSDDSPKIVIPMCLTAYAYLPMWRRFFGELGFRIITTGKTSEEIKDSALQIVNADFCYPIKAAFGHTKKSLEQEDVKFVFIPHMIANKFNEYTTDAQFCPWVQGLPSAIKTALRQHGISEESIVSPVIDFRRSENKIVSYLSKALSSKIKVSRKQIQNAWRKAIQSQLEFESLCTKEAESVLENLRMSKKKGLVIVGRPYNVNDPGLNVDLPKKLSEYGYTVIPMDFLPFRPDMLGERFRNMYWNYGQRILSALRQVAGCEYLNAIYLSNFSCGPDSFILSYAEEVMKDKPMLILELDEHGADAGYITRIEAFLDVIENRREANTAPTFEIFSPPQDWEKRRVWIPPMHEPGSKFFAAAFRGFGYNAQALPVENITALEAGRRLVRGSECLPTAATLGILAQILKEEEADPEKEALFMPTAEGPCRFGQYATCHRLALEKMGYGKIAILSPSSYNTYMGLPDELRRRLWDVILLADLFNKIGCKLRPYEIEKGSVDRMLKEQENFIIKTFEENRNPLQAFKTVIESAKKIPIRKTKKPLVGIVGEIYVRCDPFCNGYVIRAVEKYGGEAWLSPISEWILYTSETAKRGALSGTTLNMFGSPLESAKLWIKDRFLHSVEKTYYEIAGDLLHDRHEPHIKEILEAGEKYIPIEFEGEAILTVGRAVKFIEQGASLVVSANPFGCMPGTMASAISSEISRQTGVPVVNMFYDGEESINEKLQSFLLNIEEKETCKIDSDRVRNLQFEIGN